MATYTIDKIGFNSNTYVFQDSGALQLTGGNLTTAVSGSGTTTVNGNVTVASGGSIANAVSINGSGSTLTASLSDQPVDV